MIKKLYHWLWAKTHKKEMVLGMLANKQQIQDEYIIAIARLSFIKPETLLREVNNVRANAEYLLKLIEETEKNKEKK